MTRPEIDALLQRHLAAFLARNADALAADHAPDGTFESPAHGKLAGRAAIVGMYRFWLTAFPDMRFDWYPPIIDGERVALFWRFSGTLSGPFFGDVKPGTVVQMDGAAEYVVSRDGIVSARHVFDFSGVLVKTGALKVKPS
jgi:predicted ester cyclase